MHRVANDPIFGVATARSDMRVGMTSFVVALMSQSTCGVIQSPSCMIEKSGESGDSVIDGF